MKVFASNMAPKLGKSGFQVLGPLVVVDGYSSSALTRLIDSSGPSLLLWHGRDIDEVLRTLLSNCHELCVLWLSSSGVVVATQDRTRFRDRLHGLEWGLPSLKSMEDWSQHPKWRRGCIERFVKAAQSAKACQPDWTLLAPPKTPEHVIACYICVLASAPPLDDWQNGFDEEVEYWCGQDKELPRLDWLTDRTARNRLQDFLRMSGALVSGPAAAVAASD